MRGLTRRGSGLLPWLALACGVPTEAPLDGTTGTDATSPLTGATGSTGSSSTTSSTDEPPTTTVTGGAVDATTGEQGTTMSGVDHEVGDCDVFIQDCPEGQKCAWVGMNGGWPDWPTCVPLSDTPIPDGVTCPTDWDSFVHGLDDCERGSFCLSSGGGQWGDEGVCIELCMGSLFYPYCDPGFACTGGEGPLACLPMCDPLLQDCENGVCTLYGDDALLCQYQDPAHAVGLGENCEDWLTCAPGLLCVAGERVPGCTGTLCCTAFCDQTDPDFACMLPGQVCGELFGPGKEPDALAAVGLCALPEDPP